MPSTEFVSTPQPLPLLLPLARSEFMEFNGLGPHIAQQPLYLGFLSRGHPLRFYIQLSHEVSQLRRDLRARYLAQGRASEVDHVEGDLNAPKVPFEDQVKDAAGAPSPFEL